MRQWPVLRKIPILHKGKNAKQKVSVAEASKDVLDSLFCPVSWFSGYQTLHNPQSQVGGFIEQITQE